MGDLSSWALAVLPQVAAALALLIAGAWLARTAERALTRFLEQHHRVLDLTFRGVLTSLIRYAILLLAAVAALQQLGIQTASILAALGAVLVAIGLALQGTLSNIAAGLMLLWLRPFRVGDSIETSSVAGVVTEIGLFASEVLRVDGVYVFVPNSDLWSKPVSNLSRMPTRMIELRFTIKKPDSLQPARDRLLSIAASEECVRKAPPPMVHIAGVTEAGLLLALNAWVDAASFRHASSRLAERAAAALADL
jgi:small conductance mechanosensitive channel